MMPKQKGRRTNGSVLQMIQTLEIFSTTLKNDEASLLLVMAAKALAQLQSHSDTVTAEVIDWKGKYEQVGQLYNELVEKISDLTEENGQLLIKCQQFKVDEKKHFGKIVDLAGKNKQLECELFFSTAKFEASPMQDTVTTVTHSSSFSGDVYAQLDHFEDSLDMELEDFKVDPFDDIGSIVDSMSSSSDESLLVSLPPCPNPANQTVDSGYGWQYVQHLLEDSDSCTEGQSQLSPDGVYNARRELLDAIPSIIAVASDSVVSPRRTAHATSPNSNHHQINPLSPRHHNLNPDLLSPRHNRSAFLPQFRSPPYDTMPAMTPSVSIDYSISTRSSSDLLSLTPTKKTMKMSLQPNAEWAITE